MTGPREYEVEVWRGEVCLRALVTLAGRWRAATWGYAGGSPAEPPDAQITRAWRATTDHETGDEVEVEVAPRDLSGDETRAIEDRALDLDERERDERDDRDRSGRSLR